MEINIKENYSKDGKDILQLVQEWINENMLLLNEMSNLESSKE